MQRFIKRLSRFTTIVTVIKAQCPRAFTDMTNWEEVLVTMVDDTCVSTAAITCNYQSPRHKDPGDVRRHAMMLVVAWLAQGVMSFSSL